MLAKGYNGNGAGMPLGVAAQLWATPAARDHRAAALGRARARARRSWRQRRLAQKLARRRNRG